jgi:hypothetical protein
LALNAKNVQFFPKKTANFEIQTAPVFKPFVPLLCQYQHIVTQGLECIVTKNDHATSNHLLAIKQPLKVVFVLTFMDLKVNMSYVRQYYFIIHSLYG